MQTTFGAYLVALLAASSELASALPQMDRVQPRTPQGQTLSVPVKHNAARRSTLKHPALVYAKALNKFNATIPSHVKAVVDRFRTLPTSGKRGDGEGSVTNSPVESDSEYIATISVGTPAQDLPMDFDTGSSDLWVMGTSISSASKTYDPTKSSSSSEMSGYSWEISYGDGSSSSGDVYTDTVTIGNLTASKQAVEVATTVSQEFTEDSNMSGLVGLAMSSLNTVQPKAQNTFFDNIKSSLQSAVFTADLKHNQDGTYNFGYLDASQYTGSIYYADLITSGNYGGYWTFAASGYAIGGSSSNSSSSSSTSSGTSSTGTGSSSSSSSSSSSGSSSGTGSGINTASGSAPTGGYGSGGYGSGYGGYGSSDQSGSDSGFPEGIFGSDSDSSSSSTSEEASSEESLGELLSSWGFGKDKRDASAAAPTKTTVAKRSATLTDTAITGIADTGTTLLMLPDEVVTAYYAQVDGAEESQTEGGYVFSCSATLPDFTFGVGEGQITIPGDYINYAAVDSSGETCYGGIQSDADVGMAIFGDIALKAAFVVFDGAGSRVGWAAKTLS